MIWPQPISYLQLAVFFAIMAIGGAALLWASLRDRSERETGRKSKRSVSGIALQGLGFAATGFGPVRPTLPWAAASSIVSSILVALIGAAAVLIFVASVTAMGKNWSVVTRTRSDHQLVRTGPFAIVRHPIYFALLLYLLSMGLAFGHLLNLLVALPLFLAGTMIRVREEEKLLRDLFGDDHARYVREVPAFIPFIG